MDTWMTSEWTPEWRLNGHPDDVWMDTWMTSEWDIICIGKFHSYIIQMYLWKTFERRLDDIWMTFGWRLDDVWMTFECWANIKSLYAEWRLNGLWMTSEWTSEWHLNGIISSFYLSVENISGLILVKTARSAKIWFWSYGSKKGSKGVKIGQKWSFFFEISQKVFIIYFWVFTCQ